MKDDHIRALVLGRICTTLAEGDTLAARHDVIASDPSPAVVRATLLGLVDRMHTDDSIEEFRLLAIIVEAVRRLEVIEAARERTAA